MHDKEEFLNYLTISVLPSVTETEPQSVLCLPKAREQRMLNNEGWFSLPRLGRIRMLSTRAEEVDRQIHWCAMNGMSVSHTVYKD